MPHTYDYPRPAVTADIIVVSRPTAAAGAGAVADKPRVLLIQRKHAPFAGSWALPGGFVDAGEGLEAAAGRELQEETSVDPSHCTFFQVGAFGDPGRDPRGWTITVAFAALVASTELGVQAADDAAAAEWHDIDAVPKLAFDHKLVLRTALEKLSERPEVSNDAALVAQLGAGVQALQGDWRE